MGSPEDSVAAFHQKVAAAWSTNDGTASATHAELWPKSGHGAMTIASADLAGALAEAWQAFRTRPATIPAAGTWPAQRARS
jgi:hypothetical protein